MTKNILTNKRERERETFPFPPFHQMGVGWGLCIIMCENILCMVWRVIDKLIASESTREFLYNHYNIFEYTTFKVYDCLSLTYVRAYLIYPVCMRFRPDTICYMYDTIIIFNKKIFYFFATAIVYYYYLYLTS